MATRIVCIADTHARHGEVALPEGDILVHAGDLTRVGDEEDVLEFDRWLGTLPYPHKIVIAGNHDFLFERDGARARTLITNAIYLQDEGVVLDGLRFWGSPWQPWFYDWAFNLERGEPLAAKWRLIPPNTDVLVTHGPPWGIGDMTVRRERAGCADLLSAVQRIRPRLHVFGHIHEGYGLVHQGGTTFVNASICDVAYRPVQPPLVVEVGAQKST